MLRYIKIERFGLLIILTFIFLDNSPISAQEVPEFNPKELIGNWVLNLADINEVSKHQDTLEYIPYNSPLVKNIFFKYSGIQFENNGVFFQHVFIKCGTGNTLPEFYNGSWTIILDNNNVKLLTRVNNHSTEYYIYFLSSDKLILIKK